MSSHTAPSGRTIHVDFVPMNDTQQKLILVAATDLLVEMKHLDPTVAVSGPQILQFLGEAVEMMRSDASDATNVEQIVRLEGAVVGGGLRDGEGGEIRVLDLRVTSPWVQSIELVIDNEPDGDPVDANENAARGVLKLRQKQPYVHVAARNVGGRLHARLGDVVAQPE